MQAIQLPAFISDIHDLPSSPVSVNKPTLAKGQVLVRIHTTGCNFFDLLLIKGKYQFKPKPPFIPGSEFSGVIEQVHPSVMHLNINDRVFGGVQLGAYAEYLVTDAASVKIIPHNLSMRQASGIFLTYPTSYAGLVIKAQLKPNETVLIHGGAGGVGLAAIQIAKMIGATVIGIAGSAEKCRVMQDNGADHVVNYTADDWVLSVKKITNNRGVDVVYDPVGEINQSLRVVKWNARLVVIGFAKLSPGESELVATNRVLLKNVSVMGVFWGAYGQNEPGLIPKVWDQLMQGFENGSLNPVVYPTKFIGLTSVRAALQCLSGRQCYGKVVVDLVQDELTTFKL